MKEFLDILFNIKKVPTKVFFLFSILTAGLLFLPDKIINALVLNEIKLEYGKYIGIIFIVCLGFVLLNMTIWAASFLMIRRKKKKYHQLLKNNLNSLDFHEKATLREFYLQGKNTLNMPIENETVGGLLNKGILVRVSDVGQSNIFTGMVFPLSLNENIINNVTNTMIDMPITKEDEDIKFVTDNRPKWAVEQQRLDSLY